MRRVLGATALALISALVLAACGGNSYGGGSSSSNSSGDGSSGAAASSPYGTGSYGAPARSAAGAAVVKAGTGAPGTFLVDGKGRALYLWEADQGSRSMCSGACAQAWPPLTTSGTPMAGGGVKASLLGTTTRADGSREVTYAGHPLYRFTGDAKAGQVAGQGSDAFGAEWWIVTPAGRALQG